MNIAIVTDAWTPQVNGVVRTLTTTVNGLRARGHHVLTITPDQFLTVPCPGYAEIRLAVIPKAGVRQALEKFNADIVHIATEGPIGWAARKWCLRHNMPFTTAFHTRFPDYAAMRTGLSPNAFWPLMRYFHSASQAVLAATPNLAAELQTRGIHNVNLWSRGVDLKQFSPSNLPLSELMDLPRPIMLSVGRIAVEKNLEAFLDADVPGTKILVGDGPALENLSIRYPDAYFMGSLHGERLASAYASADVFVFPSRTDTFGLVMIEALASGLPVAAYPVPGPLDVLGATGCGINHRLAHPIACLNEDLGHAIEQALQLNRQDCAAYGASFDWSEAITQFEQILSSTARFKSLAA